MHDAHGWTISVDATSAVGLTEAEVDQLIELFRPYGGCLAIGQDGRGTCGATFSIHADDVPDPAAALETIAAVGGQLFRELLSEVGRDDWTVVRLDTCTFAVHDAELAQGS